MSEPQPDGYDTAVLLELEKAQGQGQGGMALPDKAHRLYARGVLLSNEDPLIPSPRYGPVEGVPPVLDRAIAYVARWPAMSRQWPAIVRTIQCFTDTETSRPLCSSSHSVGSRPGVIALTVDCPLAAAQAIVHETAHLKLRMMGVGNESADRIVANPPDALHESPIVTEMLRPMTAVLHAQYSFMHVLQLDLEMLSQEDDPVVRDDIRSLIARNAPRMAKGLATLRRELRTDAAGAEFCDGFFGWCDAALRASRDVVQMGCDDA